MFLAWTHEFYSLCDYLLQASPPLDVLTKIVLSIDFTSKTYTSLVPPISPSRNCDYKATLVRFSIHWVQQQTRKQPQMCSHHALVTSHFVSKLLPFLITSFFFRLKLLMTCSQNEVDFWPLPTIGSWAMLKKFYQGCHSLSKVFKKRFPLLPLHLSSCHLVTCHHAHVTHVDEPQLS